ncbi:DUF4159 domain-containing protein [Bartonella sp. DGB2]|uniref:DUF4159 domain-containing protein n=1 Tax=Bartonella sp. DGB2 TaxID=3388426 RepID=UPI0039901ABC
MISFNAPLFLWALALLPPLAWLLRSRLKKPQREPFPPFALLQKLTKKPTKASRHSPFWLLILRLLMLALMIVGLAEPLWRPQMATAPDNAPLVLLLDNGYATAHWQLAYDKANALINEAQSHGKMVYLVATADGKSQRNGPLSATIARQTLATIMPRPWPVARLQTAERLNALLKTGPFDMIYLSDGLHNNDDARAFALLQQLKPRSFQLFQAGIHSLIGISDFSQADFAFTLIRTAQTRTLQVRLEAYDLDQHLLGSTTATFAAHSTTTTARFDWPLELRNKIALVRIANTNSVTARFLISQDNRKSRVALVATAKDQLAQPLLEPLYYVRQALEAPKQQGGDEIITKENGAFSSNIAALLAQNPNVLIIGDQINIAPATQQAIKNFIQEGGVFIRFAGDKLAKNPKDDTLLPVVLHAGQRQFGGTISWEEPQKLAPIDKTSPLYGLIPAADLVVNKQILSQPMAEDTNQTWLRLADGTPIVSAKKNGKGFMIFIHISADPAWSNLPLSGFFVDMLQRLTHLGGQSSAPPVQTPLNPWRLLNEAGELVLPQVVQAGFTRAPLSPAVSYIPSLETPPGFYGKKPHLYAANLLNNKSQFLPLTTPAQNARIKISSYQTERTTALKGLFLGIALLLLALEGLFLNTKCLNLARRIRGRTKFFLMVFIFTFPGFYPIDPLNAQDLNPSQATSQIHLAYIMSGDQKVDETSRTGLESLSGFISTRTTVKPAMVVGLDIEKDDFTFYPLIYWPLVVRASLPSPKAIEKINAFMQRGGTILFDTRDQIRQNLSFDDKPTPETAQLRKILADLNIPPLAKAPANHAVSRAFYKMPDFPGRYRGSPLWIEESAIRANDKRPIQASDHVSSLLITANDFAAAWAHNTQGGWEYALIPNDPSQRLWSLRGGVNIIIYVLTGNYKADQQDAISLLQQWGNKE